MFLIGELLSSKWAQRNSFDITELSENIWQLEDKYKKVYLSFIGWLYTIYNKYTIDRNSLWFYIVNWHGIIV